MNSWGWAAGLALGVLAASVHLVSSWKRARVAVHRRGPAMAMLTLPFAVALPALCLVAAIQLSAAAAFTSLLGFWLLRACALARVER